MRNNVQLCAHRGPDTSVFIDAEISEEGHLVLSGQDVGRAPLEHWGDSDYEYWVVVRREHKEQVLRLLMEELVSLPRPDGTPPAMSAFTAFLQAQGVPLDDARWTDSEKDHVLLMMMKQAFGGNLSASSAFMDFLKTHGVPYSFDSWV